MVIATTELTTQQTKKMQIANAHKPIYSFQMTDLEFNKLRELIYNYCRIEIKAHKRHLLVNRLSKRLRHLGITNFSDYLLYLRQGEHKHQEFIELIDAVTTNKTDFFREPKHFTFLQDRVVPDYLESIKKNRRPFRVWSAASSTGEEPYSIAICLNELMQKKPMANYEIVASDVSETVLRHAVAAIYEAPRVEPIPLPLLRKYFLKGNHRYKVKPELCRKVTYLKINLQHHFQQNLSNFDVIFLRNVLIYFDKETQKQMIEKCWHVLRPGGYLFLGHSESLSGTNVDYTYIAPSIYQKPMSV